MNDLTVCNTTIRQDAEGRYCLNDLHRAAGNGNGERPSMWLKNKQTKALVDELTKAGIPALVETTHGGSNPSTYVAKELVYAYAMWISPAFNLKVIRAFDALMTGAQQPQHQIPQTMAEALRLAADLSDQNAKMAEELEENRPKVEFYDVVSQSEQEVTVSEAAKILGTGEKRLWQLLRDRGYVLKNSTVPAQRWVEKGFFRYKITSYLTPGGFRGSSTTTLVTGKGIAYLQRHYFRPQGVQMPIKFNPKPRGKICPGSIPDRIIVLFKMYPGRSFSESEIVNEMGEKTRGPVSYALQQLRFNGIIDSLPSPVNSRYLVWRLRVEAVAA